MPKKPRANRRRLFEIASRQAGYFTARQAHEARYSRWSLYHHVKTGTLERVAYGFYRLPEFPGSSFEDVIAAWLKAGPDRAVVSYETALLLHDLSSIKPRKVHLTVPREARRRRAGPLLPGVQIHTTTVPFQPRETIWRQGARDQLSPSSRQRCLGLLSSRRPAIQGRSQPLCRASIWTPPKLSPLSQCRTGVFHRGRPGDSAWNTIHRPYRTTANLPMIEQDPRPSTLPVEKVAECSNAEVHTHDLIDPF
jgi:hypothetical protein